MKNHSHIQKVKSAAAIFTLLLGLNNLLFSADDKARTATVPFDLNFRQIHLDFHNWGDYPDFLAEFDPEEFAETLADAHVNSVTVFGRCAQGWIYYDSKLFPEHKHPNLTRNLLPEQIDACHKRGIRTPIYIIIQCDPVVAAKHPEWRVITKDGRQHQWVGDGPYAASFWHMLCVNTPYRDFLKAHVKEILETMPVDGFFFDIVNPMDCSCTQCRADMEAQGIDPSDDAARMAFAEQMLHDWMTDMTNFVRSFNKECTIFYNSGHIGPRHRGIAPEFTHWELESLPSGGWGYLDFPLTVRYARTLGLDCMGMTGKFHTSWGDFHSYKNQAALEFECFNMLALNAKCSIGDQLHPNGRLDPVAYELIGSVYEQVEKKEPWCRNATPMTEIAVIHPEEFHDGKAQSLPKSSMGVTRMLQEGRHQFDLIDSRQDFSRYRVLVLPDHIPVTPEFAAKLETFVAHGGALIASFESGMDADKKEFALKSLGVRKKSDGPKDAEGRLVRGRFFPQNHYVEYLCPEDPIANGMAKTEYVMYARGMDVEAVHGDVLAWNVASYFDRTWQHYVSHLQTPSSGQQAGPAVIKNGSVIYFSHPIFSQYQKNAPRWCRQLFLNALEMLLPDPMVQVTAPSSTLATVNHQSAEKRYVLHLLNYIPERRGEDFDTIEEVIPLYNVAVSLKVDQTVRKVMCVPEFKTLKFTRREARIEFIVPELDGHQMILLEY
ncbi:MAG: beta-galactosidase [Calditrichaeota bacterium]|nr:MAG: beta-galactosidase [Calditrichota bacterium]